MALREGLGGTRKRWDVGLLGVLGGEVDEGAFFAALGNGEFDAAPDTFAQKRGESFAVGEVDRNEDGARHVGLVDVELLEQGGEGRAGVEVGFGRGT